MTNRWDFLEEKPWGLASLVWAFIEGLGFAAVLFGLGWATLVLCLAFGGQGQ